LLLAVLGWSFALHGQASVPRWRIGWPWAARWSASAVMVVAALALGYAGLRQYAGETLFDEAHAPGIDKLARFTLVYRAHLVAPWERGIRAALPVAIEGVVQQRGAGAVPRYFVEEIDRLADRGARMSTAALVARVQYRLDIGAVDDPEFRALMADLHRGAERVAMVHALDARLAILHGDPKAALAAVALGRRYTQGSSNTPEEDILVRKELEELARKAQAMLAKP